MSITSTAHMSTHNLQPAANSRPYQMCKRCVMDTSDPEIEFDAEGLCHHCRTYEELAKTHILPDAQRKQALDQLIIDIKQKGAGKNYDCIIGVSGGVDSTYLAYLVKQQGLRPLAVHMDNGWNSELAVSNIEKVLKKLDIDLYTNVLDWEEFKDLQIAFLKASVSDAEIPTDHAIWATLYKAADVQNVSYILLGANFVTESILPTSWTYGILDWRYIKSIHQQFGTTKLRKFPHLSFWDVRFRLPFIKGIKVVNFLDYVPFDKNEARRVLEEELEWRPYGGKHYESIYTRFFQGYILTQKFSIDKRRAHLSNLIMSKQISREEAFTELSHPPYAGYMLEEDMEYLLKKFGFTEDEFNRIMTLPVKSYRNYPNSVGLSKAIMQGLTMLQIGKWMRALGLRKQLA
ncbi:MAG: N-acetyl sugar amidotransferase [Caldilineaceae bacterium]